jgi:hypothetical protein
MRTTSLPCGVFLSPDMDHLKTRIQISLQEVTGFKLDLNLKGEGRAFPTLQMMYSTTLFIYLHVNVKQFKN